MAIVRLSSGVNGQFHTKVGCFFLMVQMVGFVGGMIDEEVTARYVITGDRPRFVTGVWLRTVYIFSLHLTTQCLGFGCEIP